ncbi:MAG: ABC transporter permease [Pyrinomonadaceae bacterium]
MDSIWKDIRYGLRGLLRRPAFTLVAVITLALGIGANTAIFTLINAVLLKPLPVKTPEDLVLFNDSESEGISTGDPATGEWRLFSYAAYRYFRDHDPSFQELSAFRSGEDRLSVWKVGSQSGGAARRASGHLVSGNYFAVLGVGALHGRVLGNEDDAPDAQPAAVISYGCWEQQWNKDEQAVGKDVVLNGTSFRIVGVMPREFFGERVRRSPDYWLPLTFQPQIGMRDSFLKDETVYWLNMLGRLKPNTNIEQAQASVALELQQFLTEQAGTQLTDDRRRSIQNSYVRLAPGGRGLSGLRFFYSEALKMLMVIVLLVLLIACANIGNLLLSRGAARQAEIALRQALGASRIRLIRQLLTESVLLAVIGGMCGIFLAQWAVSVLVTLLAKTAPLNVNPDFAVLGFTIGISLAAGLLFGIIPAVRATRTDLTSALKETATRGRRGRFRLSVGSALVISQVAMSLVLLVAAGLFARSLINLQKADLGFNRDNVLLFGVDSRLAGYKPAELSALYRQLYDRLSALPNVRAATLATFSPMSGTSRTSSITVRGRTPNPGEDLIVSDILIGPTYAETLSLPLLLGRSIGLQDTAASNKVAVVNQSFAQHFFPNQNPIGRRITFEEDSDKDDCEIVGVIGDVKYRNAKEEATRAVYRPILQIQDQGAYSNVIQIRTEGDPLRIAAAVRAVVAQVDGRLTIGAMTSLRIQTDAALSQEKLTAQLVSFFGLLALVLAAVGLYGIMAHAVVRRTHEIGIRMALGAERRNIIWMVLRDSLVLVVLGILIGVPTALGATRLISSQLFGLAGSDPLTLITSVVVLSIAAAFAGYLPARRASRVNPLVALRYE